MPSGKHGHAHRKNSGPKKGPEGPKVQSRLAKLAWVARREEDERLEHAARAYLEAKTAGQEELAERYLAECLERLRSYAYAELVRQNYREWLGGEDPLDLAQEMAEDFVLKTLVEKYDHTKGTVRSFATAVFRRWVKRERLRRLYVADDASRPRAEVLQEAQRFSGLPLPGPEGIFGRDTDPAETLAFPEELPDVEGLSGENLRQAVGAFLIGSRRGALTPAGGNRLPFVRPAGVL